MIVLSYRQIMENSENKMKLIIQIPCYNEAGQLANTVAALPRSLEGISSIEYLIIDDGSTDNTAEVAKACGVHHVVRFTKHLGLARAFMAGLEASLEQGADIIVNTDADNQYYAPDIEKLVKPIVEKQADIVIGQRPIKDIKHFSLAKKFLHRLGSWLVRQISGVEIEDAPSGFRAFSKEAASRLNIFSTYTYTLETIIQAGQSGLAIMTTPIRTNDPTRSSRLIKSTATYIFRSLVTILRIFVAYQPFRFFMTAGIILFLPGLILVVRFLYFLFNGSGGGHVQSLILASLLIGGGFLLSIVGILADIISVNRKLLEKIDFRLKKIERLTRDRR